MTRGMQSVILVWQEQGEVRSICCSEGQLEDTHVGEVMGQNVRVVPLAFTVGFLPAFHCISVPSALCRMGSPSSSKMEYVFVCMTSETD